GKGSRFHFTLPAAQPMEEQATATPVPARTPVAHAAASTEVRVLLAEDNPTNALLAERMLAKLGCTVDRAADGAEAVRLTAKHAYSLVLMDCQMPELDGYEATRLIRARESDGAHLPIVALTANAMSGDRQRCVDCGMDDYLTKPINREELRRVLGIHAAPLR